MDAADFRRHGHDLVDWIAEYLETNEQLPVMARTAPGAVAATLPARAPEDGESMAAILADFRRDILPGVTHWNHPRFFAYFPANNSDPAILGELLSAGLGVNAMLWQTSPAATELEEVVMDWLADLVGLPPGFHGCIQDTASTATLSALVCARERSSGFAVNQGRPGRGGPPAHLRLRDAHSSVVKGARIAGFGDDNVVLVDVDAERAMDPADLERRIAADLAAGLLPCCVVATVGTTGSTAIDPLAAIGPIAARARPVAARGRGAGGQRGHPAGEALDPRRHRPRRLAGLQPPQVAVHQLRLLGLLREGPGAPGAHPGHRPRVPQDRPGHAR